MAGELNAEGYVYNEWYRDKVRQETVISIVAEEPYKIQAVFAVWRTHIRDGNNLLVEMFPGYPPEFYSTIWMISEEIEDRIRNNERANRTRKEAD